MKKFAVLGLPVLAVVLALMAVTATRDTASAQSIEQGRVSISCEQTEVPSEANGWIGEVTCTLDIDAPDPAPDYSLTLIVQYEDVDQNGVPSFGDRLVCWEIPDLGAGAC